MIDPKQTDLTFYLNTYYDCELLEICLQQLRKVYPKSHIIIRSDGDPDQSIPVIARQYNGKYAYGERLMIIQKGGEIVHEMFRHFLVNPTPYLFKIDPDTRVSRPFKALPDELCVFGTVQHQADLFSIQGGCIGFTLDAVKKLYASNLFMDTELAQCPPPWCINEALLRRPMQLGLTSIDWTLGWVCKKTNIKLVNCPEIMSKWLYTPKNEGLRYAVTHPHKLSLHNSETK